MIIRGLIGSKIDQAGFWSCRMGVELEELEEQNYNYYCNRYGAGLLIVHNNAKMDIIWSP